MKVIPGPGDGATAGHPSCSLPALPFSAHLRGLSETTTCSCYLHNQPTMQTQHTVWGQHSAFGFAPEPVAKWSKAQPALSRPSAPIIWPAHPDLQCLLRQPGAGAILELRLRPREKQASLPWGPDAVPSNLPQRPASPLRED